MALLTFAQLLGLPTATEVRDRLFALLNKDDFPITDYHVGAVVRTLAEASALAIADFILEARPRFVAGVFSQLAAGDWLTFLAAQNYNLERRQATYTVQSVTLTADRKSVV